MSSIARLHGWRIARYVPTSMLETVRRGGVKAVCVPNFDRPEFDPETNAIRYGWDVDELVAQANGYEFMSMGVETLCRSPAPYARDPEMLMWVMSMLERFGQR